MRHRLDVGARQVPRKPFPARADPELTLGQINGLDSRLEREAEGAETLVRIDAVAVEFSRAAGGDDDLARGEEHEAERIVFAAAGRAHDEKAAGAPRRSRLDEQLDADRPVDDRDAKPDRL